MSQLTSAQRDSLRKADADGRALVTTIDNRIAIILPPLPDGEDNATYIARLVVAIDSLGAN